MSILWNEQHIPSFGHGDRELMAISQIPNSLSQESAASNSPNSTINLPSKDLSREKELEEGPDDLSSPTPPLVNSVAPPPDGGFRAWSQVFMGHMMNFNTWGYINSYGLFQAYYMDNLHLSASAVSWIGSMQIFLLCFIGAFSGRALDAGYYRHVLVLGCFFQVFGIFMTSTCTEYWQLFLAQGICQGIGNGLVFTPTLGLVSTYFVRKRSLAVGLTVGGSGTGGIIFPLIAQHLLQDVGFPWAVRVMGFVVLFNTIIIVALARPRLAPRKSGPLFELAAFKELPYLLFVFGVFITMWPVYYAFDYVNVFATNIIGVSSSTSLTILLVMNSVGLPGRVLPALVADYFLGPLNTLVILVFLCSSLTYAWIGVSTFSGLVVFVIIYGLINAGVQGIFLSSLSSLTTDLSKMGTRMGMVLTILAFSTLTGAPIAGALIDRAGGRFLGMQIFGGTVMLVGLAILVCARAAQTGWLLRRRM